MSAGLWERLEDLKESINGGVEPLENIHLPTKIIKIALGMYLAQSLLITLWWSIRDGVFFPWLLLLSAVLQVGWFWNKVTDSWREARQLPQYNPFSQPDPAPRTDPEDNSIEDSMYTARTTQSSQSVCPPPIRLVEQVEDPLRGGLDPNKPLFSSESSDSSKQ